MKKRKAAERVINKQNRQKRQAQLNNFFQTQEKVGEELFGVPKAEVDKQNEGARVNDEMGGLRESLGSGDLLESHRSGSRGDKIGSVEREKAAFARREAYQKIRVSIDLEQQNEQLKQTNELKDYIAKKEKALELSRSKYQPEYDLQQQYPDPSRMNFGSEEQQ